MAGLTPQGFDIKTLDQILASMETVELQKISAALDIQPTALVGILNGIVGQAVLELWEALQAVYSGMSPDAAGGDQQTSLALITGTQRRGAAPTEVLGVQISVGAAFTAAPGTMIASIVNNPAAQFTNKNAVSNPGGPATIAADFVALANGPQQCLSATLTVIAQPLTGWSAVTNPNDGIIGRDSESDPALRLRRDQELSAPGSSTADAIRADVLEQLPLTTSCRVLFNDTDVTDGNGLPPHSIEVIARLPGATGDDDQALGDLILASKAAGIATYGTSNVVSKDSQGNSETIYFSRPTDVDIWIEITVVTDPQTFPADGAARVKAALANYGAVEYVPGSTIYMQALKATVFPSPLDILAGVAGVLDVTVFKVDTTNPPTNTANLTTTLTQIALLATSRIAVTVT